jgi:hypothetical protein
MYVNIFRINSGQTVQVEMTLPYGFCYVPGGGAVTLGVRLLERAAPKIVLPETST